MENQAIIGIDIGGTRMRFGLIRHGKIMGEVDLSTPAQASQSELLSKVVEGVEQLMDASVTGIGIGAPGLIDEHEGIIYGAQNIPAWKEVHLKNHLESHFKREVHITNDANCFVLGEKLYGKGQAFKNIVGITLGTGFGSGVIIDHKLYSGMLSSAGEFGSIPYLDQNFEHYCSGKFFQREYSTEGELVHAEAINGNKEALEILYKFGQHIGNAIKAILYSIAPEAILIGGSGSKSFPFFKLGMMESLQSFPHKKVTERLVIETSQLNRVAVLGAAALCQSKVETLTF